MAHTLHTTQAYATLPQHCTLHTTQAYAGFSSTWVRSNVPPTKHITGHIGDGFYGSKDPTISVKALKEDKMLRIKLQSYNVQPTVLQ